MKFSFVTIAWAVGAHAILAVAITGSTPQTGSISADYNSRRELVYEILEERYQKIVETRQINGVYDSDSENLRRRGLTAELTELAKQHVVKQVANKLGVDPTALNGPGHHDAEHSAAEESHHHDGGHHPA